jgi:hypothetical protein
MGKLFLVCPNCRTRLSFNETPGYQDKLVICPICGYKAKANIYISGQLAQGGHGASDEATQLPLGVSCSPSSLDLGQIRVADGSNQTCALKLGHNVIGRIAQSGTADIQITHDEYMSRRHVQIDVVSNKGKMEHRLVEINSKNIVYLNGNPIERGEILFLKFGDQLTLGKTNIILEETSDDATHILM